MERTKSQRWSSGIGTMLLENAELLQAAENAGVDVMVTADQNIRYQQNLTTRRISLLVPGSNRWRFVRRHLPEIVLAVNEARAGRYAFLEVPLPPKPTYHRA